MLGWQAATAQVCWETSFIIIQVGDKVKEKLSFSMATQLELSLNLLSETSIRGGWFI